MRWWEEPIGGATRGRLIALLRRGVNTVEELAEALKVTDNAIRPQLQTLEDAGIVRTAGTRQGAGAGKPATLYEIAPAAEPVLSSAYAPVLTALLESLGERMSPAELEDLLRHAGRRIVNSEPATGESLAARVRAAAAMLTALGAEIDVVRTADGYQLRGHACPLSAAVRAQPRTCRVVEELVARTVGVPVRECCDRLEGGAARCRFDVRVRSA